MRFSLIRKISSTFLHPFDNGDGFPAYVERARQEGIDVNDWIEKNLQWMPALPILEALVFPFVKPDSVICEVGVGTGRWSRHLLERIPRGRLVLVDRSPWIVKFVRGYFNDCHQVSVWSGNGRTLPIQNTGWADLVFSQGLFITLKLGQVLTYLEEFQKALKPDGIAVFDFIDAQTPGGFQFLRKEHQRAADTFSYHSLGSITDCCAAAGLTHEGTAIVGKSTYVVVRKRVVVEQITEPCASARPLHDAMPPGISAIPS
jgi:SAM-dependent methyltransferase